MAQAAAPWQPGDEARRERHRVALLLAKIVGLISRAAGLAAYRAAEVGSENTSNGPHGVGSRRGRAARPLPAWIGRGGVDSTVRVLFH